MKLTTFVSGAAALLAGIAAAYFWIKEPGGFAITFTILTACFGVLFSKCVDLELQQYKAYCESLETLQATMLELRPKIAEGKVRVPALRRVHEELLQKVEASGESIKPLEEGRIVRIHSSVAPLEYLKTAEELAKAEAELCDALARYNDAAVRFNHILGLKDFIEADDGRTLHKPVPLID